MRDRLGLDAEPPEVGLPGEQAGADHLDCDRTVQAHLPRLEHDAHRPLTQAPDQLEVAEPRRGRGSRAGGPAQSPVSASAASVSECTPAPGSRLASRARAGVSRKLPAWSVAASRASTRAGTAGDPSQAPSR